MSASPTPDTAFNSNGSPPAGAEEVVTHLRARFPEAMAVYAFGSRVTGTQTPDSDLDLAILVPGYADPVKLWEVAGELASRFRHEVDLLDFRAASTVMQHQILSSGVRLWADPPLQADLFECYVVAEKFRLDEWRAPLVRDILREGSVYGPR